MATWPLGSYTYGGCDHCKIKVIMSKQQRLIMGVTIVILPISMSKQKVIIMSVTIAKLSTLLCQQ